MAVPVVASIALVCVVLVLAIQLLRRDPLSASDIKTVMTAASKQASASMRAPEGAPASSRAEMRAPASPPHDRSPTFDIARIEPSGEAVVAGRATPNSTVELLGNGKVHGRAVANGSGEFVIVPLRLPPGNYRLALRSTRADGKQVISKQTIAVSLNPPVESGPGVASTANPNAPPHSVSTAPDSTAMTLDSANLDPGGVFHVSGRAQQGASIKLYLNDSYVASATLGVDRHFSFTINDGLTPGTYRLRLEAIAADSNAVKARLEIPLKLTGSMVASTTSKDGADAPPNDLRQGQKNGVEQEPPVGKGPGAAVVVPRVWTTAVARGDNLWRISRSTYGDGRRYPSIFEANRTKIHNPNLIYPGQIFVLPRK
jgi:nucleoid-associated protein YgaU